MVADIQNYEELQWVEPGKNLEDYLFLLQRRRTSILIIGGILAVASLLTALLWPATFRSTGTILIEEQDIPADLVRSTITSYADQRIQVISTRVMTRNNLLQIIDQYGLYQKQREFETNDEIIERMRNDTHLNMISADVIDPRSGRPTSATIAFSLGYEGDIPRTVLNVANKLTSLYLDENLRNRAEKAHETSSFLSTEAKHLSHRISDLETGLAAFKEKHGKTLPEYKAINFQLLETTRREVMETENQILSIRNQAFILEGRLAQINPATPMFSTVGERIYNAQDQLKILETEIMHLINKYHANHPDIVKMEREIEALKKNTGAVDSSSDRFAEVTRLKNELGRKRDVYRESHPDIVKLEKDIAAAEAMLNKSLEDKAVLPTAAVDPENPAYITLNAQLLSVKDELKSYQQRLALQKAKQDELEQRLIDSPRVEQKYLAIVRNYDNVVLKYREIKDKQMQAEIAEKLESENKGERFSLVDPPTLPEEPLKPNRPVLAVLGLMLSISVGVGYALLKESLEGSVNTLRDLTALRSTRPLVAIPFRENEREKRRKKRNRILLAAASITIMIAFMLLVHFFIKPLDVIGYMIQRKLSILFTIN